MKQKQLQTDNVVVPPPENGFVVCHEEQQQHQEEEMILVAPQATSKDEKNDSENNAVLRPEAAPAVNHEDELDETTSFAPPTGLLPSTDDIVVEARARFVLQRAQLLDESTEPNPTLEPTRDWEFGIITGHRVTTLVLAFIVVAVIYLVQTSIWTTINNKPVTSEERVVSKIAFLWMASVIPAVTGYVGLLLYRHNLHLDKVEPLPENLVVVWRIVSRGINRDALASTVQECRTQMKHTPLFPYVIEVLTDDEIPFLAPQADDVIKLHVPHEYKTPKGTLFKARALHYATLYSPVPDKAWLVHLDEETHPTSSCMKGIAKMIQEEEERSSSNRNRPRIGQGIILYHRDWEKHPFLTLADNIRTGDDFGRFHLQMSLGGGYTGFGIHGSYVVCRNDVEKELGGFDFGRVGSVTEDAFWALECMQAGYRGRWVDGYMEEQSTQSVLDFLKQRRRWFLGLILVCLFAPVRFRHRSCILLCTIIWALSPVVLLFTCLHFIVGGAYLHWFIRALVNFAFGTYWVLYLTGLNANMFEHGITNLFERAFWYLMQVVLTPAFLVMEALSILYAVICPSCGFHVITK